MSNGFAAFLAINPDSAAPVATPVDWLWLLTGTMGVVFHANFFTSHAMREYHLSIANSSCARLG